MDAIDKIVENLRIGTNFVATLDCEKPKCRPFGPAIKYNGEIYLFTANNKQVYRQILTNPNIEIVSMINDMTWQRLSAEVEPYRKPEIIQAFLDDDPELQRDYSVDDNHSMPLKLKNVKATIYSDNKKLEEISQ